MKKTIITLVIGLIAGLLMMWVFMPSKIVEKPGQIIIKEVDNKWKKKDRELDSLKRVDSIKIHYLTNRINKRESRINPIKDRIINDTTKISKEAKEIINAKDSTINELAEEAETYSRSLHSANKQIASRDSVITVRDSTVNLCKGVIVSQAGTIKDLEKKDKQKTFWGKVKNQGLIILGTTLAILVFVK